MQATTSERIAEKCLVRIGRHGTKTHRGEVTYVIKNAGLPWERRQIVQVFCNCFTCGNSHNWHGLTAFPGTDPDKATCENCNGGLIHAPQG